MDDHYARAGALARVTDALRAAGLGDGVIDWRQLAPLDQFHVGGLHATGDLARRLGVAPNAEVLDLGSGLGGSARFLAATSGCSVVGIDLSPEFVEIANYLNRRTGFSDRVKTQVGDVLDLRFPRASFDFAWTQHVAMNIQDRAGFYLGVFDVLRPGGRFAMYDAIRGDGAAPLYPVPWARTEATSFLLSSLAMRTALEAAGFVIQQWEDTTEAAVGWRQRLTAEHAGRSDVLKAVGLPLVMGPDFEGMGSNFERNLREGRVRLVQVVAARPLGETPTRKTDDRPG